jgi:hypothetical protein
MIRLGKPTNSIIVRPGMTIGSIDAETDDEFLFECFVNHPAVVACQNVTSPGMVVAGRTGSGKTAILRHIDHTSDHSIHIDPSEMSLSYVSNSDTLRFVQLIGGDLDLLFLALWKHVLCIEFIRLRYGVNNEEKSHTIFGRMWDRFTKDQRKQKSLRYLREWQGKFWITMDQNIKEITEKYEDKIQTELGIEINKFKAGGQYSKQISVEKKSDLVARVRKIINADQLTELAGVIDMLAEQSGDDGVKNYYILIDKLDERWVDDSIRFKLIRALIESLRQFRRIPHLKILVALRSDILERVVQETGDIGFQREKFEAYFVRPKWTTAQLRELVEQRIGLVFRRQYSAASQITFKDIFPHHVNRIEPFDYIVERTLMRPRDVISFVNECLKLAEGRNEVTANVIRQAEGEFSRIRRLALENEWRSAFPSLPCLLDYLKSFRVPNIDFARFCLREGIEELALPLTEDRVDLDPLHGLANDLFSGNMNSDDFAREVICVLYRVGAIGLKPNPRDRFYYSHMDQPVMDVTGVEDESRIRIHPMLHRSLGIPVESLGVGKRGE